MLIGEGRILACSIIIPYEKLGGLSINPIIQFVIEPSIYWEIDSNPDYSLLYQAIGVGGE
jgi:hypothetical protein